jgi:predicted RNase H-like HicB family nuclease
VGNFLYFKNSKTRNFENLILKEVPKISLQNVVYQEGKYYVAQCLNVEVSSFGTTKLEALASLNEALELYFDDNDESNYTKIQKPEIFDYTLEHA